MAKSPSRPIAELHHTSQPSGLLSVNVFYRYKKPSLTTSNCRSIVVSIIIPSTSAAATLTAPSASKALDSDTGNLNCSQHNRPEDAQPCNADQVRADLAATMDTSSRDVRDIFPFLQLPLELRLKIYSYLFPPRIHTIVTQYPYNGFLYNPSTIPQNSTQTFYPLSTSSTTTRSDLPKASSYTTYKVLNSNFRAEFPAPGIFPHILRVRKQIREEAEPVLYGSNGAVFDFGVHLEALTAFFGDRSVLARKSVRNVRLAREIPVELGKEGGGSLPKKDLKWDRLCLYLREDLGGLRMLDLTIWSSNGSLRDFPSPSPSSLIASDTTPDVVAIIPADQNHHAVAARWREWEWTRDVLNLEGLRWAKITWWGAGRGEGDGNGNGASFGGDFGSGLGDSGFDSWLAGRMLGDGLFRGRMVKEGVVLEEWLLLRGLEAEA